MGTYADFYVGRGPKARWVGSIDSDGQPENMPKEIRRASTARAFRAAVRFRLRKMNRSPLGGAVVAGEGEWPHSWTNSAKSDFAYAFDRGLVYVSNFGGPWIPIADLRRRPRKEDDSAVAVVFPEMTPGKGRARFGPLIFVPGRLYGV